MKKFVIEKKDVIQGGTFEYSFDPLKKNIHYELHAVAKKFFITKRIDQVGDQTVEPHDLLSGNYNRPGKSIKFAGLTGKVVRVEKGIAEAEIGVEGFNVSGKAWFDIVGVYIDLIRIEAAGSYGPISFQLVVRKA